MQITLEKPEFERFVRDQVDGGLYTSAAAVIEAGLSRLMADSFEPGELNQLAEEGEESLRREGTVTLDEAMRHLKEMSATARLRAGQ